MMEEKNYAFIDGQNLDAGLKRQGWMVDYKKFRKYLSEKHSIGKAFIFLGYIEKHSDFYEYLEKNGYIVIFKEISWSHGKVKANCDAEMIFSICLHFWNFDKAVIVAGDGDYYSIAKILNELNKLEKIIAPKEGFSQKFYKLKGDKVTLMGDLKNSIGFS